MKYTISQVAEEIGCSMYALRAWERAGLVSPAGRTGTNRRIYDDAAIAKLKQFLDTRKRIKKGR